MFKKILAAICCSAALTSAALAYDPAQTSILVGTASGYPPYEFLSVDGTLTGFDIDLMEAIGQKIGKTVQWYDTGKFDSLLAAISAGKVDCAIAGISATEERAKRMLFSDLYEITNTFFLVDVDEEIANLEDLRGKIGAVQQGSAIEIYLMSIADRYGFTLKVFPSVDDCVLDIVTGRSHFSMMDIPVAKQYMALDKFQGKVKIGFNLVVTDAGKAIALPKANKILLAQINQALKELDEEGFIAAQRIKWGLDSSD